jgi:hypothetical protein
MLPHPIIMNSIWHDRNRMVQAAMTRQQQLDQLSERSAPEPTCQRQPTIQIFASLALALGLRKSDGPGVPA